MDILPVYLPNTSLSSGIQPLGPNNKRGWTDFLICKLTMVVKYA